MNPLSALLNDKVRAELDAYLKTIRELDKDSLIAHSRETAAMQEAFEFITKDHIADYNIEYLLSLKNPLAAICDQWMEELNSADELIHAMWVVCDHQDVEETPEQQDEDEMER
jgi:hypothetical protein